MRGREREGGRLRESEREIASDGERIRHMRVEEEREAKINDRGGEEN